MTYFRFILPHVLPRPLQPLKHLLDIPPRLQKPTVQSLRLLDLDPIMQLHEIRRALQVWILGHRLLGHQLWLRERGSKCLRFGLGSRLGLGGGYTGVDEVERCGVVLLRVVREGMAVLEANEKGGGGRDVRRLVVRSGQREWMLFAWLWLGVFGIEAIYCGMCE